MRHIYILAFSALLICSTASAQTAKIKQLELQRKKALQDIENTNKLLIDTKKVSQNLITRINLISNQIESRKQIIDLMGQEVDALAVQQTITQKEIDALELELKGKQKNYAKAIDGIIYRKQSENKILYILSGKSLAESMRRIRFLKEYSDWRGKEADAIKEKTLLLQKKKADLGQQRKSKIVLINQKDAEQQKLKDEEKTHQQEISDAKSKQQELQGIIADKKKQANQLNQQISQLIAEEVARQEREARRLAEEKARRLAAQEKARKEAEAKKAAEDKAARERAEAAATAAAQQQQDKQKAQQQTKKPKSIKEKPQKRQSQVVKEQNLPPVRESETPQESESQRSEKLLAEASSANINLSNNFASNKGRLPIPVTGRYSIVSGFGTHQHGQYVTTNSNGIDIQTQVGADARSVFNGEVSRVVAFPGFNNCIIIRHGNYYTFYGNIQNVYVRQGQAIKTGQSIGKVFTDPDTGVTKMHFQLWNGTSKQDPSPWLRR